MLEEIKDCFGKLSLDNRVNAIVLAAHGRAFSAGIDGKITLNII
jgi:enoyl-CoA hydratase/carnithine racemase